MKKLSKISLLFILVLMPINVFACPHADSEDVLHLQIYNSDYTIVTMIYPRENYLYAKDAYMEIEGSSYTVFEENILKEQFGFPIYQDATSYITYYWFLDDTLLDTELDDLDVDITVEKYDSLYVEGDGYNLDVGLTNTYDNGVDYINDLSYQIYYEVNVEKINDDEDYLNLIKDYELNLINEDIYDFDVNYMITEISGYTYDTKYIDIFTLYDEIDVSIYSEEYNENVVAINLNKLYSNNFIEVSYENNYYNFSIESSGVYVLAEYKEITEEDGYIEEEDLIVYEKEEEVVEKSSFPVVIIIGVSVVAVSIFGVVTVINNKKRK